MILLCTSVRVAAQVSDTLRYTIKDRRGDALSNISRNPFDIRDTALIKQDIRYDPKTRQYYIIEKIGNRYYRKPTYLSYNEFWKIRNKQAEADYFKKRADALAALNKKVKRPEMRVYDQLFDRMFGLNSLGANNTISSNLNRVRNAVKQVDNTVKDVLNTPEKLKEKAQELQDKSKELANRLKVDIRPTGDVNIMAGYQGQNIKNPTLPERARKNGGFDFDMNTNLSVNANIGEKLKFPINYNTLSNLNFDNQIRLDYKGLDDELIKRIEAGNISFQTRSTLIPSTQNLFGIKTQLQFGKLFVTTALANQKSSRQTLALQGGAATQDFQKKLDDYEENRHFLLGAYFYNNFNKVMQSLPVVNSQVQIQRMEVWITNRTGATTDARDIVGLMDLAEPQPYNPAVLSLSNNSLPNNGANDLYSSLVSNPNSRNPSLISSLLQTKGLRPVDDYEKTFARKLNLSEYTFNPQAGFLSINTQLQPDEVLAVAFQYTYNGRVYQVGEFAQDVALDSSKGVQKVLFLKLLKATSQRVESPLWKWMMKNVYSLDVFGGIQREDFKLNILYEEPSGGLKRYLPETSPAVSGLSLLRLLNLDRLNNRNDPQPDGVFDFVEGFTVLQQSGRIVFPVLEPFGRDLDTLAFAGLPAATKRKYVYYQLYDSIKAIAQTYANLNRYVMQGQIKGTSTGSEIYLNAFNVPPGSVSVTAGGQILREGLDYTVDYNLGTVRILNSAIINSNIPVKVAFENNAGFGIQQRGFTGLRLDYAASKKLALGYTAVRLGERPFFTKMSYGDDPIKNTMYGVDFNYQSELPGLTRLLNKLPFYSTKARSAIAAYGEGALLKPGHPAQIGKKDAGLIFIDDFEGTRTNIDLRFPFVAWSLASTPQGNPKFPEAALSDSIDYNFNRAKLAWYTIEPNLQDKNSANNPLRKDLTELSDPRVRQVFTNELFPQRTTNITDVQAATFDLAYYPTERGPYNYETRVSELNTLGRLSNPAKKWGGIMRAIDQTDFETGNIEFFEVWMQDPFITNPTSKGGKVLLNLGNISEDLLKDGKRFYENGLNTPNIPAAVDSSGTWGRTPVNPIQITQAFSNNPDDRPYQDVGFDGLDDAAEVRNKNYILQQLANNFGINSPVYNTTLQDPSGDNYRWYRDNTYDQLGTGILGRYKNHNNPQGNSPVATTSGQFTSAATLYPDNEDLNRDNTLNETESYYEYEIDLKPGMNVGVTPFVTDRRTVTVNAADGTTKTENWFLLRIPIKSYARKVGNIPDFKSIRFVRLYLTDFEDSVVLRLARMDLVRNQWRQFAFNLDTTGSYTPINNNAGTTFNTLAVNLEENSSRQPVNYIMPPDVERVQLLSNNGVNLQQNEQAMSLRVKSLISGDARAVFKTLNFDIRQYGKLSMYLHAESVPRQRPLEDDELYAVVRIGQDFLNNYYEVRIPLKVTLPGIYSRGDEAVVWPDVNNLDISLRDLIDLKIRRNNQGRSVTSIYRELLGTKTISVMGNPNLGEVRGILVGIENKYKVDGPVIDAEVWVNELRLSQLDESAGWAALGRVDLTLADLGSMAVSVNTHSAGFGSIEQRINERSRENLMQFDVAANINAGKLLPAKARISLPVYASINKTILTPQYDPYDKDVKFKDKVNGAPADKKDSIRRSAVDQTTIRTLSFNNVRVLPGNKQGLLSISNFDFSYSYSETEHTSPVIEENKVKRYRGGMGYNYNAQSKFITPFKKLIRTNTPWLQWIKEFNFNLKPSYLSFRADINRQYGEFIPRIVNTIDSKVDRVDTTYDKYFTFDRFYNMRWDLSKSLNFDFSASNNARVDEPYGRLDTKSKKDTVRNNFFDGGRNTLYQQKITLSYDLPFKKIPLTEWITARYSYGASYNWIGASRLAIALGNTIENSQENNFNAQFNFSSLYAKSRWMRALDNYAPNRKNPASRPNTPNNNALGTPVPTKAEALKDLTGKKRKTALIKWRQQKRDERTAQRLLRNNQTPELNGWQRTGGKLITMLKTITLGYSAVYKSRVPGFMDSPQYLGQNWNSMAPGLGYVLGQQPDTSWLNARAAQGLISRDSNFNFLFRQNFDQRFSVSVQLEPAREFTIDLNLDKTFSKEYSELFKDTIGNSKFNHLTPLATGGFSVSYIAFKTLFGKNNPNEISTIFKKFEANRLIISKRVAENNPYWQALPAGQKFSPDGYATGYGRYAQDVLVPAFLAAYTGKDPNAIALLRQSNPNISANPFGGILPRPNWNLTYTGMNKIGNLAKKFTSISITHGYNGSLSMNSFNSALLYQDPFGFGGPGFIDTVSGNYIPFFLLPNITMQESFEPLFGINLTTTSQFNLRFDYKKSRMLSLSLIDYQLSETRSTGWSVGIGWRARNIKLPFKIPGANSSKLQNDMTFKLDIAMRDVSTSNSRLDQANAYGTGGQKEVTILPSLDYVLNSRVNIRLFFDQRRITPYISTAAPTTTTRAGINVRVSLSQ